MRNASVLIRRGANPHASANDMRDASSNTCTPVTPPLQIKVSQIVSNGDLGHGTQNQD